MLGSGLIERGSAGVYFLNDGTVTTIMGIAGDYIRIGDATTTGHSLSSEDDLLVTNDLEVDGVAYLDGGCTVDAGATDAGIYTTGGWRGLYLQRTGDDNAGFRIKIHLNSASPAAGDTLVSMMGTGKDDAAATQEYGDFRIMIEDETAAGGHSGKMEWHNFLNGGDNTAMTLSAAGILSVDETGVGAAAQVDLFDDYDDALMLKMGVQERNHDLLVEMGVFSQKEDGRYMMNIQPMTRLLAGGIYQNRAMIDRLERELAEIKRG